MKLFARGEANSVASPKVWFAAHKLGRLVDVFGPLTFEVFDTSTPAKRLTPVSVASGTINLVTGRLGTGRYAPSFTIPADGSAGRWVVRFTYVLEEGDAAVSETHEFEVTDLIGMSAPFEGMYCSPQDLKDEGIPCGRDNFPLIVERIRLASRFVEKVTKQFFEPRYQELQLDGRGGRALLLGIPVIAVDELEYETSPYRPSNEPIEPDLTRVYNRHLSGMLNPDDRNNPKIELYSYDDAYFSNMRFPRGSQNVKVSGIFGYTDPDPPSMLGTTPTLINHVTKLIVMRELPKLSDAANRDELAQRYRLTSERTRDQSYTLEGLGKRVGAFFTGDPLIDSLLASFVRPPSLGAA